ncbi:conserved hypothetical protein [Uncinocarpus reesii 1704]|uniref:chitinase n=1 Tax=Uncinocarpus reesii (strain UAMH 1704) TaxID=336963 RepID=C4JVY5_UNCRE|nr:uncharacterized protein UREG_06727 [Uncinocarpus reesii 1704]EEP81862.1 conserved hypothetical protein [Uncinocarpus reesii 1704]
MWLPPLLSLVLYFPISFVSAKSTPSFSPSEFERRVAGWQSQFQDSPPGIPKKCPVFCEEVGLDPVGWSGYSSPDALKGCNETMLLDFPVHRSLDDPNLGIGVRACVAEYSSTSLKTSPSNDNSCISAFASSKVERKDEVHITQSGKPSKNAASDTVAAASQLRNYLASDASSCTSNSTITFAFSGDAVVGLYAGAMLKQQGVMASLLNQFIDEAEHGKLITADTVVVELCGSKDRGSDFAFGIAVSTSANIGLVQDAVKEWSSGRCAKTPGDNTSRRWKNVTFKTPPAADAPDSLSKFQAGIAGRSHILVPRGDCRTISVDSGDSCASLASKCGVSGSDFTKYNPGSKFCSTLAVGQRVCCSAGDLPDIRPKPKPDGHCADYTTQAGDFCAKIAASNGLTVDDLEEFNKDTWAWNGCKKLQSQFRMCLSKGKPPMPAPMANAICGPQVPGTEPPIDGVELKDLNPCPIKACCNVWGQCGVTEDFCNEEKEDNPNYCVASCGMDIVKSDPPAEYIKIGYFEAFNWNRPCLNAHIDWIDWKGDGYTHIHYGFASITRNFEIDVSEYQLEFDRFKALKGVKRIVSFGGWGFSTEPATYDILRSALAEDNRLKFKENVVKFINEHDLDGVDFDWEYPGAPDIPGIPPGKPEDAVNYLLFLFVLWGDLPSEKSLSIAAPASYWYLKQFPIDLMSQVVDYIVYMTYDLHGQWDYKIPFVNPGCPNSMGNCLRSHVNLTETTNALAMVTKAGAPSNKIIVGVSSYGRSFKMTQAGCHGETCTFVGPESGAKKGECTDTAGYVSNAEIEKIIKENDNILRLDDHEKDLHNILVYNDTEWVAYMDSKNKAARRKMYQGLNMGGTVDWAVDLEKSLDDEDHLGEDLDVIYPPCNDDLDTVDEIVKAADKLPGRCVEQYLARALSIELKSALEKYDQILKDGYDRKFGYYSKAVKKSWEAAMDTIYQHHIPEYFNCLQQVPTGDDKYKNETGVCPPEFEGHAYSVFLIPKDEDKFFKWVAEKFQVLEDWIFFDKFFFAICLGDPEVECKDYGWIHGIPKIRSNAEVPNPKKSIADALKELRDTQSYLADVMEELRFEVFDGFAADVVDGAAVPVYMVKEAIANMEEVAEIGEEIEEEERKRFILLFLTAFLFVLPGLGQGLAAVTGLAVIARITALVAEIGGAALSLHEIAENPTDPANVFLNIFGAVLGAAALRNAGKLSDAAKIKRGLSGAKLGELGDNVKKAVEKISPLVKACRR